MKKASVRLNGENSNMDKSGDVVLLALQKEAVYKFAQLTFKDAITQKEMAYNLLVPENYNKDKKYPLVLFIADANTVGRYVKKPLIQGYGALVWATNESQDKNPSFILVPSYTMQTVNDKFEITDEVDMTIRLLYSLIENYNIDTERLYTTGQSMGGMMSMYFDIAYPDLFAASVFVSCQWDVTKMQDFDKRKFFYIVAGGDEKALKGMISLKTLLENEGVIISAAEWSAKLPETTQYAYVEKLLSEKNDINFITFTRGSVLPTNISGMEHMWSFDYAYQLKPVRDWLFIQNKKS